MTTPVQYFYTRPKLLALLQMVGAKGQLFTVDEVVFFLGKYIEKNKLYDPDNKRIVRCKNDLLGEVFEVDQFTVTDFKNLWKYIFPCLLPATKREMSSIDLVQTQSEVASGSELPWWYFATARDGDKDDDTDGGSYTGRETIGVCDTEDDSDDEEVNDSDDTIPVLSDSEVPVLEHIESFESESFCDRGNSDFGIDPDIALEEHWICPECRTRNVPTVGYCQRCWKLRRGWLMEQDKGIRRSVSDSTTSVSRSKISPQKLRNVSVADGRSGTDGEASASTPQTAVLQSFSSLPANPLKRSYRETGDNSQLHNPPKLRKLFLESNVPKYRSEESLASTSSYDTTSSSSSIHYPGLCNICRNNPNDSTIIHRNSGHQFCCYSCAKRLKRRGKSCPVCRQPIMLVIRNYVFMT